jgi:hypothetical protein
MSVLKKRVVVIMGIGLIIAYAAPAAADCESDEDCGPGYVCETYEFVEDGCAEDKPDCPPDVEGCLPEPDMDPDICDGEVRYYTESYCRRAECETDADCGEEMICIEYVEQWCTGGDMATCDEGEDCEVPDIVEEECGTEIYRECGYSYEAPCEEDADCGEGFNCVPQEDCYCEGSDPGDPDIVGDVDDEVGFTDGDFECFCEPTGDNYCQLQEIECATDEDCPAGLFCDNILIGESDCVEYENGEIECSDPEITNMCRPEGWYDDKDGVSNGNDADVDIGANNGDETDIEEDDNKDNNVWFDDINIDLSVGCTVSAATAQSTSKIGLLDLLRIL